MRLVKLILIFRETEQMMVQVCESRRTKENMMEQSIEQYRQVYARARTNFERVIETVTRLMRGENRARMDADGGNGGSNRRGGGGGGGRGLPRGGGGSGRGGGSSGTRRGGPPDTSNSTDTSMLLIPHLIIRIAHNSFGHRSATTANRTDTTQNQSLRYSLNSSRIARVNCAYYNTAQLWLRRFSHLTYCHQGE